MAHIDCSFYSQSLRKNAHVIVFIPTTSADDYLEERETDYFQEGKTYPVLYLLHGSYGDCTDWYRFTGIERYAQEKGLAVVMPSAENSSYVKMKAGEDYLAYITEELPEFLGKIFPFSKRREETFLAGLSMGGYGAYRCGLEKPERYGAIASLSGALDREAPGLSDAPHARKMPKSYVEAVGLEQEPENNLEYLLKKRLKEKTPLPDMYMTCGTEDFIFSSNEVFYEKALKAGVTICYEKHPGVHDWNYWDTHIRDVLKWLPI